jgi:hypothetical protein
MTFAVPSASRDTATANSAPYVAPVIMWIAAPSSTGPNSKWKALPAMPLCIEAIMLRGEKPGVLSSGGDHRVRRHHQRCQHASRSADDDCAAHPIRDRAALFVSTRLTIYSCLVRVVGYELSSA